jgi:aquaporin Z
MLFALLLIGGPITGAHYNPAVTIGVYVSNRHWKEDIFMFFLMIAAQIFGAILGTYLVWLSIFNLNAIDVTRAGVPESEVLLLLPNEPTATVANAFMVEMICTFIFVLINLLVKTGKTSPSGDGFLSCLAVAFTLLAMICVAHNKSGACLNPAVGIAQTLFEII